MPTQLVNTRGHYPKGYPRGQGAGGGGSSYDPAVLEQATDKLTEEQLQSFKSAIEDAKGTSLANDYFSRNLCARDWWYARWANQTIDGRKWGNPNQGIAPWPWAGASDSRIRTVERIIGQHRTLATYAYRNMKLQAKSTRPAVSTQISQQATTLLNWMLYSHMQMEFHREMRLAQSWRNGYGAAVLKTDWKQSRMLDYIDVSVMGLQEFINEPAVQSFVGGNMGNIPIGEGLDITDLQSMIMDPSYADDLSNLLRAVSHDFLSFTEARKKLDDLRQLRTVQVPVPYVFESRPRIIAYRPMVDVLFNPKTFDFNIEPWTAVIEYVSETTLRDRIETAGYDPQFVEEACERRGPSAETDWRVTTLTERSAISGTQPSNLENDIELYHFYTLAHDRGVPVRFCTVFHMDVEIPAKHEPDGYDHGESCFHPMRFEIEDRPILSSRGIAEIAYTWEQELKTQYDAQADRTALSLRPPLMTTYDQVQKMKENVQPGVVFPMRRFDEYEFMKLPPWDQVSILVIQEVEKRVKDHFGIFGIEDVDLMKLRREEFVDDVLFEFKPPSQQIMKLMRQLLPDAEAAMVVGPLNRPFHIKREDIQGEFEISGTVDLRDIDTDWMKEKGTIAAQLLSMDVTGQSNRTGILKTLWAGLDYSLADIALQDQKPATQAEVQDEQKAIDLIIGSGQDQPLPEGANYQLRLQTLQAKQQAIQQNPATMKIIQGNPDIIKVLLNRAQFFQRQLQQQQNAQIGRMQVGQTFSNQAPSPVAGPVSGEALENSGGY